MLCIVVGGGAAAAGPVTAVVAPTAVAAAALDAAAATTAAAAAAHRALAEAHQPRLYPQPTARSARGGRAAIHAAIVDATVLLDVVDGALARGSRHALRGLLDEPTDRGLMQHVTCMQMESRHRPRARLHTVERKY